MTDPFVARMALLDDLIALCRREGIFGDDIVRDASNRSGRDWPWWSVKVERTDEDGALRQRMTVEIYLNAPAPGTPSRFEARWSARIWYGTSEDSFRASGSWPLPWDVPQTKDIQMTVASLFQKAAAAIAKASFGEPSEESV
jgi:hypothetical protein